MNRLTTLTKLTILFYFLIAGIQFTIAQEYVPFTPRLAGGNLEIRGDIVFVGNNILNRASEANPEEANTPYNGTQNNNSLWMEYIDIDTDPTTFSSSSAELNLTDPSCSQVRYAGLYWAGTYPNERSTNGGAQFSGTTRSEEWNEIKFRVPGGAYVDLIADNNPDAVGEEDDIIMNGYQPLNPTTFAKDAPVICYKNITDLVRSNTDPNGEYTAANVRATRGRRNGSSSAGWVMVIIYENPNESGKFISTFDGYAGLSGSVGNVDVSVDGFRTLPAPFPVRARIGVGALEGDRGIRNDRFFIRADLNSGSTFTNLTTGLNPDNNFFNSTITTNGAEVPTRTPYGTNTLGTDLDLFNLNNPSRNVLPNAESGATLRFTSSGDGYGPFLATFSVEIIEPNIVLEKKVEDIAGNDITGLGVNLGQTLDYVLSFRNLGNDDGVGYTIRDVLPTNTTFLSADVSGAAGVTYTIDTVTNEIIFSIPDDLIQIDDPTYAIRMTVRVAENCFDFVDACTDLIQNLAYSTYQGRINSAIITDDPSVSDFDNCGFVTPGATNFLLDDLASCNFSRTAQLCGDFLVLDSGDGFDNYVWYEDVNRNGLVDALDVNITAVDGNPDNDPSTIVVTQTGMYIVDKQIADPCKGFLEIITVERFGDNTVNPIVEFFNDANSDADPTNDIEGEVVSCSVDGDLLPKIFLCGSNDSQLLQVNIADTQSMVWERWDEDETSCTNSGDDCANKNLACNWNQVNIGNSFTATTVGKYRLVVNYQNGCLNRFYFNVFQNILDIDYTTRNVVCETPGNITVTNIGSGYGFQLVDIATNTISIPFSANNGPSFDFTSNGAYRVEVVQLDPSTGDPITGACIFSTPDIGILNRAFQVDLLTTDANCNTLGNVQINANNVLPNYSYELRLDDGTPPPASPSYTGHPGGTLVDDETAQANNTYTFNNVNPGNYFVVTRSDDGCVDVQGMTINRIPDPTLSAVTLADIGCTFGSISLTRAGGQGNPDFLFAVWSKDGTVLHTPGGSPTEQDIVDNIDPNAYQVETTFTFGWRDTDADGIDEYFPNENGTYQFIVLDANNCYAISSTVVINDNGGLVIDSVDEVQPSCSGEADASVTINLIGGVGPYQYSIDNGVTYQSTPTFVGLSAGPYQLRVLDSSGCDLSLPYSISEPFPLSASAGVSRDATCDPNGGEVRITNVVGGSGTYEYSFDGGSTWGITSIAILPPGDYTVLVRDGSCSFPMNVTVEGLPAPPNVALTPEVNYNCDGTGTITASPSISGYNYRYELDGVPNTPDPTSNVFNNVGPGTYTVTTYYSSQTPPTPSLLLSEDFGVGNGTIPSPDTRGYAYEDQTTSTAGGGDTNRNINDFQYSVTNDIVAPFGAWISPNDHTDATDPDGRFLVINVGTPSPGQIIYTKPIQDIIPNRPLTISLYIFNLVISSRTILDPDLTIEIVDTGGTVIQSIRTGDIAKNTGPDDWVLFTTDLDPGANTNLDFVIRTEKIGNSGNDLALDDIEIFQIPEVCELFVETPVTVVAGEVFGSTLQSSTNVSCNGLTDGTITFQVANFDAVAGFEYSEDGGTIWITSTSSPVTTNPVFGAGNQTVLIRKANEITCATSVSATITAPSALIASATITTDLTCTNGATITANASGGTAIYNYQLEDAGGAIIGSFDFTTNATNRIFSGLLDGNYIVRVRDANNCEDSINTPISILPLNPVVFNTIPSTCYDGGNNATIQVNVTNGNAGYQFRINAGPWLTPSPFSATTYTFQNLSNGSYDIDVRDQNGCPLALATQTVLINPDLAVSASAPNITACDTDSDVTIIANGGDGNYTFAIVASGATPLNGDFNTTNPVTGFVAGNYDVYVRDNDGNTGYCSENFPLTITQDAPINVTPTPIDVTCFGVSNGAISIAVNSGGQAPFMYSIDNGVSYSTGANFPNLSVGSYPVRVRDANLCESVTINILVDQPDELVGEAIQTQEYTCAQLGQISVGSVIATTGGSGDYQYSINGASWTPSTTGGHTFTDLDDDTYVIRVRDANATGCFITLPEVIIYPLPLPPTVDYTVIYNCDGTGNVTITPFDASYIYILDGVSQGPVAGADVFNNIAVGSYALRVTYGTDCHVDTTVIVADGNAFEASITAFENLDCNSDGSGSITINAANYGAGGYEYSVNGGAFVSPFTSPQTITGLNAQNHNIVVRDVDDPTTCTIPLSQVVTEPALLGTTATITEEFSCNNLGATITASATGGTPTYEYQLEISDDADLTAPYVTIISVERIYQNSPIFNNVSVSNAGESYVVRVRDTNNCEDVTDTAITVVGPDIIVFDVTPTACYTGNNDGSVVVDVTAGNGGYQFRLDGGPWRFPTPANATTYTFQNLSNGSYDIEVRDQFGCPLASNTQTVTIHPELIVDVAITALSACSDGAITANATGGNGTLLYAIVPANTSPAGLYTTSNSLIVTEAMAIANPAGYDVYVQDNNGASPTCSFLQEDIILVPVPALTVSAIATDPECFNGLGLIDVTVGGGTIPYDYTLVDLSPADGIDYGSTSTNISTSPLTFNGIGVGNYQVVIADENGCTITSTAVTINNATEITADIVPILPANCDDPSNTAADYGFRFDNVITATGTVEYSDDWGTTWQASNELRGNLSGTEVFPSIRVTLPSGTICQVDFDRYVIPFPLDDLDITINPIILNCNDLQVTVQGSQGNPVPGYQYTYTDDPANFSAFSANPGIWTAAIAAGTSHTFANINPTTPQNALLPLLVPGRTYVFYVKDGSGCIRESSVNVNNVVPNLPIDISVDITPTCFGTTTGALTFNINPDAPQPQMRWEIYELGNPIPVETSGGPVVFSSTVTTSVPLGEGDYYIDVIQVDGANVDACRGASENVYVPELPQLSATAVATRGISCNLPGLISINGISGGGGAPYTYDVSGPSGFVLTGTTDNPVEIPVNSPAGNYIVTLYDQYSCPLVLNSVALTLSANPTITTVTQDNCSSPIDITVVGNSAAGGLRYAMLATGGPIPTTFEDNAGLFTNVAPGSYDFYVTDANGCIAAMAAFIVDPVLSASATLTKLLDCTPTPEAVINIEILDGSGNYEYSITNTAGAPAVIQTSVPSINFDYLAPFSGDYTITIYDSNTPNSATCNREFLITVPDLLVPIIDPTIIATDITCIGDSDGTITITALDNAIGPFVFEITSLDGAAISINPTSTTNTSATFTGLSASTTAAGYIVTITGNAANNCSTASSPIIIAEPAVIAVTMNTPIEFGCIIGNNQNNASISVQSVTGGSNTFVRYHFYTTDDPLTAGIEPDVTLQDGTNDTYIETNTIGGYYAVQVYDTNGCSGVSNSRINPFDELLPATITVDQTISCIAGENITINAFGLLTDSSTPVGLANYEFRELPNAFAPSNVFTNLVPGTYTFEVRNINTNCIVSIQHTVNEPNNFEITATTTDVVCDGTDGAVSFSINDPVNPYAGGFDYQVFEQITNTPQTAVLTHLNPGPTALVNLQAGDYYVVITQNGNPLCSNPENFNIAGPNGVITGATQVEQVTCALNNGVIEIINPQGGWGGYEYFVALASDPLPTTLSFISNPRFIGLLGGVAPTGLDYQVWIKDQNDCMQRLADVTLLDPEPITAGIQVNQGNCSDFTGEIEVTAVSGGQGSNYIYQLLLNGSPFGTAQNTNIFGGLGAGSYEVQITDQWSCASTTTAAILYDVISPRADIDKTIDCNSGGEITITQTGGSGIFDYSVIFPDASTPQPSVLGSVSATFTNLIMVGDYLFTITDTATGHTCSTTVTQRLEDSVLPNISIDDFTDVTCNSADDGTITVNANPDNGIGPYTFTIISGPGSSSAIFPITATSNTDATAVFTGLEGTVAGIIYTIRVTSPNGCTRDITQVILQPNVVSNFTATTEQFACTVGNNANLASISVDVLGLSGGSNNFVRYRFVNTTTSTTVQDGPNAIYVETNYNGGVYEITAFDDNGCASPVATETINPFIEISDPIIVDVTPVSCTPGNDAQIQVGLTVNPSSATPNVEYELNGINVVFTDTNPTGLFTGLDAGNYRVTITNLDTNCIIETVHTIDVPEQMQVTATKLTDDECLNNGVDDGSFSVAISPYTGTYTYQVFDANNNPIVGQSGPGNTTTPLIITGLPGGAYYVRVEQTQAPFCTENSNVITVIAPEAAITATVTQQSSVTCSNDQGSLLIDPEGGQGPYTIVLDNTITGQNYTQNNVAAYIFTDLSAGAYTIIITDSFGCEFTDAIALIRPDDIVATLTASTLVCYGDNDASATASVALRNVSPTYQYQLNVYTDMASATPLQSSVGQVSSTFNGLDAGYYSITVTDDVGCATETNRIQILDPTEVSAQLVRQDALTCLTDAVMQLTASGGTAPYVYSQDGISYTAFNGANGPNTQVFSNVTAGTYSYFVQDAFNCTSILSNEITESPILPLTLIVDTSAASINCTGDSTALIFAEADGGLGNYQYALYTDVSLSTASRIAGPQSQGVFTGLPAGIYFVEVVSEDCIVAPERVEISAPIPLDYTEEVVNISCFGGDDGRITITMSGGTGIYQYAISPNLDQFDTINTFTDLSPGDYTVIAQDSNGCFEQLQYTISEPTLLTLVATPTPEVCVGSLDGSITLNISGGTAPYSTSLNSNSNADFIQDQLTFTGLGGGNYLVFVRDANDCDTNVVVDIAPGVNLNATIIPVYECNGDTPENYLNITLEDQTVLGDVLYALDSTDSADMQLNPDFRNTAPGMHYIAIAHSNGCIQTFDFEIEAFEPLTLVLEQSGINQITATVNGGRPGYTYHLGDTDKGEENVFIIYRTDTYLVTVVDENGCEVQANIFMEFIDIEIPNFFTPDGDGQNDFWTPRNMETFPEILIIIFDRYGREIYEMDLNDQGWDGLYQKSELPTGDYWYVVKLNGVEDNRELIGHFTLYR